MFLKFDIVRADSRAFSVGQSRCGGNRNGPASLMHSMLPRILCLLCLCALPPAYDLGAAESGGADPLRRVLEVRGLSRAAISQGHSVDLEGVVTYLRNASKEQFNFNLNDQTGGVMVYPKDLIPLRQGQRVRVRGTTDLSREGLRVNASSVEAGPVGEMPPPVRLGFEDLYLPENQGLFVEVEATVRCCRLELPLIQPRRLAIDIGRGKAPLTAWILRFDLEKDVLLPGTKVRLRGAALHWLNPRGQIQSVSLMMNSIEDVDVVQLPAPPFSQSIDEVLHWNKSAKSEEQISTSGTVTCVIPGELVVIQDGSSAIRVRPLSPEARGVAQPDFAIGDRINVSGFPVVGEYSVELEDAQITDRNHSGAVIPDDYADAEAVFSKSGLIDRDGRLIRLDATVLEVREREGKTVIELMSGRQYFSALLPLSFGAPAFLEPGAQLRLTGICTLLLSEERRRAGVMPNRFSLVLPDANHVELLRAALWWNSRRLWAALASVCGLAGLAGVFAFSVGRKNRALKMEIARREAAENRLFSERVRMASDLHDNLEQTLLATSLQLNAATRTIDQNPEAAVNRLALAGQLLARGRKEVKEAVWDLQFGGTQRQLLSDILRKECAEASAASATEICCSLPEDEPLLPASFIAQVLRIVRESLTNAFKHAAATQIRVAAVFDDGALSLTVVDNGRGFDPQSAPGPDSGHFGLSNMVERAKKLGGTLDILRAQGGGTSICVRFPLPE